MWVNILFILLLLQGDYSILCNVLVGNLKEVYGRGLDGSLEPHYFHPDYTNMCR